LSVTVLSTIQRYRTEPMMPFGWAALRGSYSLELRDFASKLTSSSLSKVLPREVIKVSLSSFSNEAGTVLSCERVAGKVYIINRDNIPHVLQGLSG
jgi:hypothetical protein